MNDTKNMADISGEAVAEKQDLFRLFFDDIPVGFTEINSSRSESDFREVVIGRTDQGRRLLIKLADNDFTFPEKIMIWQRTVEEYRALGFYCPKIYTDKSGRFPYVRYKGRKCVAYAEEYSVYSPISRRDDSSSDDDDGIIYEKYFRDIWAMTAKVAAKYFDFTDYPSGYCLFECFCPSDKCDEVLENALEWKKYADTLPREFSSQVERIWKLWNENRTALEKVYGQLPRSVFQADLNPTNLLADENGNFVGVMDFNLCGRDVFLNYLIRENFGSFESDMLRIPAALSAAKEYYRFSDIEKSSVLMLYRCISTLWYTKLEALKQAGSERSAIAAFLDKTEHYLTADIDFVRYMG